MKNYNVKATNLVDFTSEIVIKLKNKKVTEKRVYYYKGNPYTILSETKIKVGNMWKDCVVYKCEYENPDGDIWVRQSREFFELFKPKPKRPTVSIEDYLNKAHTYSSIDIYKLNEYVYYGALEEIGELTGKLVKSLRGDYAIIADDRHIDSIKEASGKYIRYKDLMLEVGDIIWMLHMRDRNCLSSYSGSKLLNISEVLRSIWHLTAFWTSSRYNNVMSELALIMDYFGYTLEEVLYLNIEKLEQRRINNTIKGSGDNR